MKSAEAQTCDCLKNRRVLLTVGSLHYSDLRSSKRYEDAMRYCIHTDDAVDCCELFWLFVSQVCHTKHFFLIMQPNQLENQFQHYSDVTLGTEDMCFQHYSKLPFSVSFLSFQVWPAMARHGSILRSANTSPSLNWPSLKPLTMASLAMSDLHLVKSMTPTRRLDHWRSSPKVPKILIQSIRATRKLVVTSALLVVTSALLVVTSALLVETSALLYSRNKCLTSRNKCLLVVTSALLVVTSALLVETSALLVETSALLVETSALLVETSAF